MSKCYFVSMLLRLIDEPDDTQREPGLQLLTAHRNYHYNTEDIDNWKVLYLLINNSLILQTFNIECISQTSFWMEFHVT